MFGRISKSGIAILIMITTACNTGKNSPDNFKYQTEQFADLKILRYQVPGFDELSPKQKELAYYLYQAALSGREITYDQHYKHNLCIKRTLETIVNTYTGERKNADFDKFMTYTKRVWFSNGIHHHYSATKFLPEFSPDYFIGLVKNSTGNFPLEAGQTKEQLTTKLIPILFNPNMDTKKVNLDSKVDMVVNSANNFYENISQKEVEDYYAGIVDKNDSMPVSYGINSKLTKKDGKIVEETWKVGGMYDKAMSKVVYWLQKAVTVAENDTQKAAFEKLIEYYQTGNLRAFDDYNKIWVKDTASTVDFVNGFIETYGDALGYRGTYESVVSIKDFDATKRIAAISSNAQWFEDHSPIAREHKKAKVTGISAKVITVVAEAGDASPSTPIGINLPNADWIRKRYGSKSVNLGNIVYASNQVASGGGMIDEFAYNKEEVDLAKKYGALAGNLHTDMHEVIGHASGQLNPGVATPKQTLKNYSATLEEARADLVGLYYIMDPKLVEIGVIPTTDVGKTQYNGYIRNGLMTQLVRLNPDDSVLQEAHMRNRQLIASWVYEKGKPQNVIEKVQKDAKTYFVIHDYNKLRDLFGQLLKEIQRIKSEGDYNAAKQLVDNYGVKVDVNLHHEVLARYKKLNISPYNGFINPKLVAVMDGDKIKDVKVEYPEDFTAQMLEYAKDYALLPNYN